jgi:8-oxo-dGTP pyrophosphatase MutT (NUDIX family)
LAGVTRIVCFFLVDQRGHLLMQEKDEHAPRGANQWGANQWGAPGGHVDPERIPGLDLWPSAACFLPQFLASSAYTALRKG